MIVKPRELHIKWKQEGRIYPGWHRDKNWVGTEEEYAIMNFMLYLSNGLEILEYDTNNSDDMILINRIYNRSTPEEKVYLKKYVTPDKDQ